MTGKNVYHAKKYASSELNGLFTKDIISGINEGKYYRSVNSVVPFVYAFTDHLLGCMDLKTKQKYIKCIEN